MSNFSKSQFRKQLRDHRSSLAARKGKEEHSALVFNALNWVHDQWPAVRKVFIYWPLDGEPDLRPMANSLSSDLPFFALPVMVSNGQLAFFLWNPGDPVVQNACGIVEPLGLGQPETIEGDTVIFVPSIAVDSRGFRLGYGGGYYDRLMAQHPKAQYIGVVWHELFFNSLAIEDAWDRWLPRVVTQEGVFECQS